VREEKVKKERHEQRGNPTALTETLQGYRYDTVGYPLPPSSPTKKKKIYKYQPTPFPSLLFFLSFLPSINVTKIQKPFIFTLTYHFHFSRKVGGESGGKSDSSILLMFDRFF